uniref:MNNL domain-containing protein n=1 Tax=Loa loa TaxID=7209 RepID=A0A1I7VUS9_LOALO
MAGNSCSFEIRLVSLTVGSKEEFRPELRICLKHFEKRISYNGECTFGEVTLDAERLRNGTKIEFQFGWPKCIHREGYPTNYFDINFGKEAVTHEALIIIKAEDYITSG